MSKAYLLVICLLAASFTGCLGSDDTEEEYKKKTDELRKKVIEYQSQRKSSLDAIAKKRSEARKKLLDTIDPIVAAYTKENSISIVVDKKAVLFAVPETDITNTVVEKLNKKSRELDKKSNESNNKENLRGPEQT